MTKTSVSSISIDRSIQSISVKSDLLIFIDLSIHQSIQIFIDWLLWYFVHYKINKRFIFYLNNLTHVMQII